MPETPPWGRLERSYPKKQLSATYRSEAAPRSRIALVSSGSLLSGRRLNSGSDLETDAQVGNGA